MCTVAQLASPPEAPSVYPRGRAPEFYVLDTDILQAALDRARTMIDAADFVGTDLYCEAILLYAAHSLSCLYPKVAATSGGPAPGVTSKRAGDLAITYAAAATAAVTDLGSTSYGRELRSILRAARAPRYFGAL